jgi:hypothetical protein
MSLKSLLDGSECLSHVLFSTCTAINRINDIIRYTIYVRLCRVLVFGD